MASKDDDNTPISSSIPGPPQHEAPIVSVQPPTPLVHTPPSPTIGIVISPPSTAPPSIPPLQSQDSDPTRITQQNRQSSRYPSTPHPRRHSLDFTHQGALSSITPFIPTHSVSGSPHTPVDDAGENENRNASAPRDLANSQVSREGNTVQFPETLPSAHPTSTEQSRHSSWVPPTPNPYRYRRPDLDDQDSETQRYPNTPFIPPLSSPSGSSSANSDDRAGVNADYRNSGWDSGLSPVNYRALGATSYYGGGLPPSTPWTQADYPLPRPQDNHPTPSGAGAALRYVAGVRNVGNTWGTYYTPWVGVATRGDEAAPSAHPVTSPNSTHPTATVTPTHPNTANPTSTHPTATSISRHPVTNPSWAVHVYSETLQITGEMLHRYQVARSKLRFESQLNDLFSGSLGLWLRCFFFRRNYRTNCACLTSPANSTTPAP